MIGSGALQLRVVSVILLLILLAPLKPKFDVHYPEIIRDKPKNQSVSETDFESSNAVDPNYIVLFKSSASLDAPESSNSTNAVPALHRS